MKSLSKDEENELPEMFYDDVIFNFDILSEINFEWGYVSYIRSTKDFKIKLMDIDIQRFEEKNIILMSIENIIKNP